MPFLYGDATESALDQNYIAFLKNFLQFSIDVLSSEADVALAKSMFIDADKLADQNREHLDRLRRMIHKTIKDAGAYIPMQSETHQAAQAIWASTETIVKQSLLNSSKRVAISKKESTQKSIYSRTNLLTHLEHFLINQNIPESKHYFDFRLDSDKKSYVVRQTSLTSIGLETVFVSIPQDESVFTSPVKVKTLELDLSIQAPTTSGLVKKSTKVKTQSLAEYFVVSYRSTPQSYGIMLRQDTSLNSDGFNVEILQKGNVVKVSRVSKTEPDDHHFECSIDDSSKLVELSTLINNLAKEFIHSRVELLDAKLNGEPIKHVKDPKILIEKLVELISPEIRAISERSLTTTELVLKNVLDDGKREEIFANKKELIDLIERIPEPLQYFFNPLGLDPDKPWGQSVRLPKLVESPKEQVQTDPPTVINDELTEIFLEHERGQRVTTADIVDDTIMDAETSPPPKDYAPRPSQEAQRIVDEPNTIDDAIDKIKDEPSGSSDN